jgi:hypothetical protein
VCAGAWPRLRRNRVSLFYQEKLLMLLHFCQTFGLMRMLSQTWTWPPFWRRWTAPMLLFNLDTPAFYYRDFDDGDDDLAKRDSASWPLYTGVWLAVVFMQLVLGAYARYVLRPYHKKRHAYHRCTYFALLSSEVLFLPALLALPRTMGCALPLEEIVPSMIDIGNMYTNGLGAGMFHSAPECGSATHVMMASIACLLFAPFLLGYVITQFNATHKQVIYTEDVAHEMFLRSRELEYLLSINDHWGTFHYHTFASFQRRSVYGKTWQSLSKLVLACAPFFTEAVQTSLILGTVCAEQLSALVWPRYRCTSSRAVHKALGWTAICNIGSGWLLSLGVRSFFLVDSHLQYYLIGLNAVGAFFMLAYVSSASVCASKRKPSKYASAETRLGWPVTTHDAQLVLKEQTSWIEAINEAHRLMRESRDKLPLFIDPMPLHDCITAVEGFVNAAADQGSLLWPTLDETMQDLVILYSSIERRTLLPNPVLEELLPHFAERIVEREETYILTRPKKRRILLKLLALRTFLLAPQARARRAIMGVQYRASFRVPARGQKNVLEGVVGSLTPR